jgi:hypothetical protein
VYILLTIELTFGPRCIFISRLRVPVPLLRTDLVLLCLTCWELNLHYGRLNIPRTAIEVQDLWLLHNYAVRGGGHERKSVHIVRSRRRLRNLKIATGNATAVSPWMFRNFVSLLRKYCIEWFGKSVTIATNSGAWCYRLSYRPSSQASLVIMCPLVILTWLHVDERRHTKSVIE